MVGFVQFLMAQLFLKEEAQPHFQNSQWGTTEPRGCTRRNSSFRKCRFRTYLVFMRQAPAPSQALCSVLDLQPLLPGGSLPLCQLCPQPHNTTAATSKPSSLISASPLVTSSSPSLYKQNFLNESAVYACYQYSLTPCSLPSPAAAWPLLLLVRSSPRLPMTYRVQGRVPSSGLSSIHTADLAFVQKCFLSLTSVVLISFLPL